MMKSDETTYWLYGNKNNYKGKKPDKELVEAANGLPVRTIIRIVTNQINKTKKESV